MTWTHFAKTGAELVAIGLAGVGTFLALQVGLVRAARRYGVDPHVAKIPTRPPQPKAGFDTEDPDVRQRARWRREEAERLTRKAIRARASSREAGEGPVSPFRRVG